MAKLGRKLYEKGNYTNAKRLFETLQTNDKVADYLLGKIALSQGSSFFS